MSTLYKMWSMHLIDFVSHLIFYGGIVGSPMFTGQHTFQIKKKVLDVAICMIDSVMH